MNANQYDITVVIPCYNEEKNLERGVLGDVYRYLKGQTYTWEVILINDESTDGSRALIAQFIEDKEHLSLYDIAHGGKPAAVWAGIQRAQGNIVVFTDMDQSTPISELSKLLPWYRQDYDVVIGSRGYSRQGFSILRQLGSVVFRTLRSLVLLRNINDTQCGFKSCRRSAALEVFPHLQFFTQQRPREWKVSAYDVELLYLFELTGHPIKEVVVDWRNRDESDTKGQQGEFVRYLHESVDMAKEVIRVKLNQRNGLYDKIQN